MKITAITTQEYQWPRAKPITNGLHTYTHVDFALVKIETDVGLVGIGLGKGGRSGGRRRGVEPPADRRDPIDAERLWHKMLIPKLTGRRGLVTCAISSIDIGLWDIRGKAANMLLYKLLGGRSGADLYRRRLLRRGRRGLKEPAQEMNGRSAHGRQGHEDQGGRRADRPGRGTRPDRTRDDRAGREAADRRQLRLSLVSGGATGPPGRKIRPVLVRGTRATRRLQVTASWPRRPSFRSPPARTSKHVTGSAT